MKKGSLFVLFITIISCQSVYQLSDQDRRDLQAYPEKFLIANGKKKIVKTRKIEITDSLRRVQELDITQENIEEMNLERE